MEGATATLEQPEAVGTIAQPPRPSGLRREAAVLVILVLFAAGVRLWLIRHTEVAARDSIGFIRYALQLEDQAWPEVFNANKQHPGYPLAILAVSGSLRLYQGQLDSLALQRSAQLASALAGILLVVPMYLLGKEVFGRSAGFWGAVLFQCLPVSGRILSDGLSEALFLLLMAVAMLFAARALKSGAVAWFILCGLVTGLAYLTRPEGLLILAVAGSILIGLQFSAAWRRSWLRVLGCGTALVGTAVAVGAPYAIAIGGLTNKPTGQELLNFQSTSADRPEPTLLLNPGSPRPLLASVLAVWSLDHQKGSWLWGLWAVIFEILKAYYYVLWLPALLAAWWFRDRAWMTPGYWVLLLTCFLHLALVWRVAVTGGYVSERHVLVPVLAGVFAAATGITFLASRLAALRFPAALSSAWPALVVLVLLTCCGLLGTLRPLHPNRAGHRAAGLWLAEHATPYDSIYDPFCWAYFYAGGLFWEGRAWVAPPDYQRTSYVVLEGLGHAPGKTTKRNVFARLLPSVMGERPAEQDHARLPLIGAAQQLATRGQVVYHWPPEKPAEQAKVVVFAVVP